MKSFTKILICFFCLASAVYAEWPEKSDFVSSEPFKLDTAGSAAAELALQNNSALAYSLNWGSEKAASVKLTCSGAKVSPPYEILTSSDSGPVLSYCWDYEAAKAQLPVGEYTLSHETYDSTSAKMDEIAKQVMLLPEPLAALVLGLLAILALRFRLGRVLGAMALLLPVLASYAATSPVESVQCRQRWPWNGKVDIAYTLTSEEESPVFEVAFVAMDGDEEIKMTTLSGEGADGTVSGKGQHVVTWDAGTDCPLATIEGFRCCVAATKAVRKSDYFKFNLVDGTVSAYKRIPEPVWTDEDKTESLWFVKIPATADEPSLKELGQDYFVMGSPKGETGRYGDEIQHNVTLTKDFYIGVFQLTEAQYAKIMGDVGSSAKVKGYLSYNILRGVNEGSKYPSSTEVDSGSVIGKLRNKFSALVPENYRIDLPTEAQWEYACRGPKGWGSTWNDGSKIKSAEGIDSNLSKLGWYKSNSSSQFHNVGLLAPNGWGLYDMHGNCYEFCLDWYGADISSYTLDPVGPKTYEKGYEYNRVMRGGAYGNYARYCRSAFRSKSHQNYKNTLNGARIAIVQ